MSSFSLMGVRRARSHALAVTRLASSLALPTSWSSPPSPPGVGQPYSSTSASSLLEASKDRTLLRMTQGDTVVLASLKESSDGRALKRGSLSVEYKQRSFAQTGLGVGPSGRSNPLIDTTRHDRRTESVMTDAERCVASRIQRMVEFSIVGVPAKRRMSLKLTVISAGEEDPELVAVNAASAVLGASGVPWYGPFGAIRVLFGSSGSADASKIATPPPPRLTLQRQNVDACGASDWGSAEVRQPNMGTCQGSMVVVSNWQGHVLYMRGISSTPRTADEITTGVRVALEYVRAQVMASEVERATDKTEPCAVTGADPAAGRRIHAEIEKRLTSYLASLYPSGGTLEDLFHHIESVIKPEVSESLQREGRWRHEGSRIRGSGCVTVQDLDHTIDGVLQSILRRNCGQANGLQGLKATTAVAEVGHTPASHATSMFSCGGTVVESAVTCSQSLAGDMESMLSQTSNGQRTDDPRVSSVFLTCSHGASTCLNSSNAAIDYNSDLDRATFVRDAVCGMLPPPDVLPFALRTNTEVLCSNTVSGVGSMAAAVNGISVAIHQSFLANYIGKKGSKVTPWTAASVGLSYRHVPGSLDGEEYELPRETHGWCTPQEIEGYHTLRDVSGLSSLVTDAELTIAGPAHSKGPSISAWTLQCHSPTRITHDMISSGIEAALDVREVRRTELAQGRRGGLSDGKNHGSTRQREQHAMFGDLTVSTASMPRILAENASILRRIEETTGGLIYVKAPGVLSLFAPSPDAYARLEEQICAAVGAFLVPNRMYRATVTAVKDFGAFVSLPRCDIEAMLHISEVSHDRIASIDDELAVGDVIDVVFLGEDSQGGLRVSKRKATTKRRQGQGQQT